MIIFKSSVTVIFTPVALELSYATGFYNDEIEASTYWIHRWCNEKTISPHELSVDGISILVVRIPIIVKMRKFLHFSYGAYSGLCL